MPGFRVLIIQESPKDRMNQTRLFEGLGFLVDAVPDGVHAESFFFQNKPDMVIADISTPNFNPFEFLKLLKKAGSSGDILFLSHEPDVEEAVLLMKEGAMDYLILPVEDQQLELYAKQILSRETAAQNKQAIHLNRPPVQIITSDTEMLRLMMLADKIADSTASVLIQGESGTGKELFAKYIHEKSKRKNNPFIAVNCAALPENLLESELFGHEKGSFTGAISTKIGKFELAHTGTLFLDEITEMQIHLQAKLLRVLQEKTVDRVGGSQPISVDVRIIATTNQDVDMVIEEGKFRKDLYYRLNTIPLVIPPLRERPNDLEKLCTHFIQKYNKIDGRTVKGLTKEVLSFLSHQNFSGNVRELENIIHRAVLLADGQYINPQDLLMEGSLPDNTASFQPSGTSREMDCEENEAPKSLREMEQKMIYSTLDETEGNRTHAAKILGISVRTLRNKLNEYKELS